MTDDKTAGAAVKKRRPSKRKLEAVDDRWQHLSTCYGDRELLPTLEPFT